MSARREHTMDLGEPPIEIRTRGLEDGGVEQVDALTGHGEKAGIHDGVRPIGAGVTKRPGHRGARDEP